MIHNVQVRRQDSNIWQSTQVSMRAQNDMESCVQEDRQTAEE